MIQSDDQIEPVNGNSFILYQKQSQNFVDYLEAKNRPRNSDVGVLRRQ